MSERHRDTNPTVPRWDGALCALAWLGVALLTRPFVEAGLIDDFSYVKSAWVFADTHRLVYNGWATAMIGWQIVWGAVFAALLGHTYTAVRISNFVTSFACVWMMHAVCVRCGLTRRNAAIATLAVATCPLFLPMSVSFMTDISGLLAMLACFYCCLRANEAEDDARAMRWLIAATVLGIVGATARQIAWMSPLVMVPSTAWLLRRRKGVIPTAVVLWLLTAAAMIWSVRWFAHQPLIVPEPLIQGAINFKQLRELLGSVTAAGMCFAMVLLPFLAAWTRVRLSVRQVITVAIGTPLLFFGLKAITLHGVEKGLAPWTGDLFEKLGMLSFRTAWTLGIEPSPFSYRLRLALSVAVLGIALWFAVAVRTRHGQQQRHETVASQRWHDLLVITVPFLLAYSLLLTPRAMWSFIIDRYLLPLAAFAFVLLLRLFQQKVSARLPAQSIVLLALFAAFSVAGTHDWIAMHRARQELVERLQRDGVPRTAITAGYEMDGLEQINRAGTVYDPRVKYPAGMNVKPWRPDGLPHGCREIFNEHTPVIHAVYFISADREEPSLTPGDGVCLVQAKQEPLTYRAWMPPLQRHLYVLERP